MAEKVLTAASSVKCVHGFAITLSSGATLRVGASPVVRSSELVNAVFACTAQQKCTLIKSFKTSTSLRDGTMSVVLATGLETNFGPCSVIDVAHDLLRTD